MFPNLTKNPDNKRELPWHYTENDVGELCLTSYIQAEGTYIPVYYDFLDGKIKDNNRGIYPNEKTVHRQTSERQTSETTNVRTTNVRKDKRQKGQTSEATNVGSDKRQKDKHRKRQTSEATNIRKSQNLILLTFVWLILYKYKINHTKVNNLS